MNIMTAKKKQPHRTRPNQINVRLSDAEYAYLKQAAARSGLAEREFVLKCVAYAAPTVAQMERESREILKEFIDQEFARRKRGGRAVGVDAAVKRYERVTKRKVGQGNK